MNLGLSSDQGAVVVGSSDLTGAGLPCSQISDLIGAGSLGVVLTAGAGVVVIPAVNGAGSSLALGEGTGAGMSCALNSQSCACRCIELPLSAPLRKEVQILNTQHICACLNISRNGVGNFNNNVGVNTITLRMIPNDSAGVQVSVAVTHAQIRICDAGHGPAGRNNNFHLERVNINLLVSLNSHNNGLGLIYRRNLGLIQLCAVSQFSRLFFLYTCRCNSQCSACRCTGLPLCTPFRKKLQIGDTQFVGANSNISRNSISYSNDNVSINAITLGMIPNNSAGAQVGIAIAHAQIRICDAGHSPTGRNSDIHLKSVDIDLLIGLNGHDNGLRLSRRVNSCLVQGCCISNTCSVACKNIGREKANAHCQNHEQRKDFCHFFHIVHS